MVSKAKIAANSRYNAKTYDVLSIRVLKSEHINELLDKAIAGSNVSKAAYILTAIREKLASDGVMLDISDKAPGD